MEHWNRLTPRQLVIAASCALMVAGVTLADGGYLGYGAIALAALCGIGAFVKSQGQ